MKNAIINNAVQLLADKYAVDKNIVINDNGTVAVDDKVLPLMPWRSERRFIEMKNVANGAYTKGISTMRVFRIDTKDKNLFDVLYREIDICEWVLDDKVCEIFALKNVNTLNAIAKTSQNYICTFELAITLGESEEAIDKHEVIAEKGVICDRVVDTQIPQNSIYVLGNNDEKAVYTDVDAELFGLNAMECSIVRQAFKIAKENIDLTADAQHVEMVVSAAKRSIDTLENIRI